MIITRLTGGLGNQMFQYAAGLSLAEHNRTVLKLDVSWYKRYPEYEAHNRYALSCFNVCEQFATEEEVDRYRGIQLTRSERWLARVAHWAHFYRYSRENSVRGNWYRPSSFRFSTEFFNQPDGTYLDGMFQSEKYFLPVASLLRLHFSQRYPQGEEVRRLREAIASGPSVAVHFRRGDYASNETFSKEIGVLGYQYYARSVAMMAERHPGATFYVFSDDIDWVAREFRPNVPCVFVRGIPNDDPSSSQGLMSLCDHFILANSTFGWWVAWLNPSPQKTVIAPDPWFAANHLEGGDVVPESWLKIQR